MLRYLLNPQRLLDVTAYNTDAVISCLMQIQTTSLFILVIISTALFFKNNYSSKKGLSPIYSMLMPITFYLGLFLQLIIFILLIDRPVWGETLWEYRSCNVLTS